MDYRSAKRIADSVIEQLKPYCKRIAIAGSVRRQRPEVKDIEICLIPENKHLITLAKIVNRWHKIKGDMTMKYTQRRLPEGIKLDIFVANPDNWGIIFAIRTGSAYYSKMILARGWSKMNYKSKDGVLYPLIMDSQGDLDFDNPVYIREERDLFNFLGIDWVDPTRRE